MDIKEPEPIVEKAENKNSVYCSCILYLREVLGVPIYGDAHTISANSYPAKGHVILLKYKGISHAAYILETYPGGVFVKESNYKHCKVTERFIAWNSPEIRGFWSSQLTSSR